MVPIYNTRCITIRISTSLYAQQHHTTRWQQRHSAPNRTIRNQRASHRQSFDPLLWLSTSWNHSVAGGQQRRRRRWYLTGGASPAEIFLFMRLAADRHVSVSELKLYTTPTTVVKCTNKHELTQFRFKLKRFEIRKVLRTIRTSCVWHICGQSYNGSIFVNYESTGVPD